MHLENLKIKIEKWKIANDSCEIFRFFVVEHLLFIFVKLKLFQNKLTNSVYNLLVDRDISSNICV